MKEDRKHDIAHLGNFHTPYINNEHVNGGQQCYPDYTKHIQASLQRKVWQLYTSGGQKIIEKFKFRRALYRVYESK